MYKELDGITSPEDDAVLWRYMSLEKFANILATQSLFFTRADNFDDKFEGHIPRQIMSIYKSVTGIYEKKNLPEVPEGSTLEFAYGLRKHVMCNCWYQAEQESMAMWDKYHMRNSGIAIKTTTENLKNSLPDRFDVFIGAIQYLEDHNKIGVLENVSIPNLVHYPYFYKRKSFEHEHEVRVLIEVESLLRNYFSDQGVSKIPFERELYKIGMPIEISVETLIGENGGLSISPYAEQWVIDTVASIVGQYGFQFSVNRSRLSDEPGQELKYLQEKYGIRDEIIDYFITTMFNSDKKFEQKTEQEWELWREAMTVFAQLTDRDKNLIRTYQYHDLVW